MCIRDRVIREGLSKGADRGIHIETESLKEIDPLYTSKVFAETLSDENFDLILSGLQSDDSGMGQTGVLLGELLNMSTATLAIETDIDLNKIRVKRELESGWFQWVELESPSSISIQSGINQLINTRLNTYCLLYTSPSPRDATLSRMPSSA